MAQLKQPGRGMPQQTSDQRPDPYNLDPTKPKAVPNMMGQQPQPNTAPQGTPSVTQPGPPQLTPPQQRMSPPAPQMLSTPAQSGSMYGNGQGTQVGGQQEEDPMSILAQLLGK